MLNDDLGVVGLAAENLRRQSSNISNRFVLWVVEGRIVKKIEVSTSCAISRSKLMVVCLRSNTKS